MRKTFTVSSVRWARAALVGISASAIFIATVAQAQTWSGPSGTAPSGNTPDLIWNSAAPGFGSPQSASFSISGSGTLGGNMVAAGIAAGGYNPDPAHAITTPTLWAGAAEGATASYTGSVSAPQFCIAGNCISGWPSGGGGGMDQATADARYVNVTGDSMTGNLTLNAGTSLSSPRICLNGDCRTVWPAGGGGGSVSLSQGTGIVASPNPITGSGSISLDTGYTDGRYVNNTGDVMSGQLTVNTPGIGPSINTSGDSGVQGVGSNSWGVRGVSTNSWGVTGESTNTEGVRGYGRNAGGYFQDSDQSTAAYVAYGTYGFYTTSANNQMNGLTVSGTLTANTICLGGVCNSSWPAGGGGLDIPTADGRYVNVTGDSMTGALTANASSGSPILHVTNTGAGQAVYGQGILRGASFRDSDNNTVTELASGPYGIYSAAASNYLGGLQIASGGSLSLGGVSRTTWPGTADFDSTYINASGDTMTGLLVANAGIRMGATTRNAWPTQAFFTNTATAASTGWITVNCPGPVANYVTGFVCSDDTTSGSCRTRLGSTQSFQYFAAAGRTYSFTIICLSNIN